MKLDVIDLNFSYDTTQILHNVTLSADKKITAVIGPNGAGKTTLMACIAGIKKPSGTILLDDVNISDIDKEDIAKWVSYLPQEAPSMAVLSVLEAVLLGRLHSLKWKVEKEDIETAYKTLCDLGIKHLATRSLNELSGGQRQMVSIAQAVVKNPEILLMDEPTNSLDLQHQLELFDLIKEISEKRKITALIALHDLNLAARYADNIILLHNGVVLASGAPSSVLTTNMIETVYEVYADVSLGFDGYVHISPICSVKGMRRKQMEMARS